MQNADAYLPPGAGDVVDLGGMGVHFKVRGEQTGGSFAIVEHPIEPGVLVDPHIHQHEDELSFVLEGTVWARVGDQEIEAVAGSYIWKPRNVLHTLWNPGPGPSRILEVISPAGFERLFDHVAAMLQTPSASPEEEVYELCRSYVFVSTAPGSRTWKPGSGRCASSSLGWRRGAYPARGQHQSYAADAISLRHARSCGRWRTSGERPWPDPRQG